MQSTILPSQLLYYNTGYRRSMQTRSPSPFRQYTSPLAITGAVQLRAFEFRIAARASSLYSLGDASAITRSPFLSSARIFPPAMLMLSNMPFWDHFTSPDFASRQRSWPLGVLSSIP